MAINANMIYECRTTGSSTNGGGFRGNSFESTPSAPAVTPSGTGGTVAAGTYYFAVTFSNIGETALSPATQVTTTGTTSSIVVTSPSTPGQGNETWNLYCATSANGPFFPQGTGLAFGSNRTVTATPPTSGTQPPGVDRSQQDSPQLTIDNSTVTATTTGANSNTLTFTGGYTPTYADVGNIVNLTGGTNINAGRYEITAITSTTWTLTGSSNATTAGGAGSAITGKMGGAVDHPATIAGGVVSGNQIFIKRHATNVYSFSNSSNVSGGKINVTFGGNSYWQGYDTTRKLWNTDANRPTLRFTGSSYTMVTFNNGSHYFLGCLFDNPGANAGMVGISAGTANMIWNCKFSGVSNACVTCNGDGAKFVDLECVGSTGSGNLFPDGGFNADFIRCVAHSPASGTSVGFQGAAYTRFHDCIAAGLGGIGFQLNAATKQLHVRRCVAYGNASHGFAMNGDTFAENCIAYGNGSSGTVYGFNTTGTQTGQVLRNCAGGSNFTANVSPNFLTNNNINFQALSGNPFVAAGSDNFSLNNTAGAGASCRGVAVTLPGTITTSYLDIGVSQHQDAGGGALFSRIFTGQ